MRKKSVYLRSESIHYLNHKLPRSPWIVPQTKFAPSVRRRRALPRHLTSRVQPRLQIPRRLAPPLSLPPPTAGPIPALTSHLAGLGFRPPTSGTVRAGRSYSSGAKRSSPGSRGDPRPGTSFAPSASRLRRSLPSPPSPFSVGRQHERALARPGWVAETWDGPPPSWLPEVQRDN